VAVVAAVSVFVVVESSLLVVEELLEELSE
jgi:hypothetical protein